MNHLISISFLGEGSTDYRFFSNIVVRLIESLLLEQRKEAVIQWQALSKNGNNAQEIVYNASKSSKYSTTLILHSDTDNRTLQETIEYKFQAGLDKISKEKDGEVCKNIVLLIPVTETEAWMLVDKELLKSEINTTLSNTELGLTYLISRIEEIADPKQKILDAINIYRNSLNRKRKRNATVIDDLYETIGQAINLDNLEVLDSYKNFKSKLIQSLINMNILE